MGLFTKKFDFQVLSTTMMGAVSDIFGKMCSEKFTRPPEVKTRAIWVDKNNPEKMSASGFDKHIGRCYVSAINFYFSPKHMEKKKTCGAMIVYTRQSCASNLLRALKMSSEEKMKEKDLMDMLGEFCNMMAGSFKSSLAGIEYVDLTISAPLSFRDEVEGGVDFDFAQDEYQEFRFSLWQETAFIVDLTLSAIPKSK